MPAPVIIEPEDPVRLACVLVHGRGQTPADLAPLVDAALAAGARVVMPVAAGKSWYAARAVDPLTAETEAQLRAALDQLQAAVLTAHAPERPFILAGFSQGACLVAEYLLQRGGADAACILTGARVGGPDAVTPVRALRGVPVYLSGADADPWIPRSAFQALAVDLQAAGARLRSDHLPARPHVISVPEVAAFSQMAEALAAVRLPFGDAA